MRRQLHDRALRPGQTVRHYIHVSDIPKYIMYLFISIYYAYAGRRCARLRELHDRALSAGQEVRPHIYSRYPHIYQCIYLSM